MTRLTDERIAEIEAKLASYGFKDSLGHPLTNCKDFQDLLTEVKALREEIVQAEAERDVLLHELLKETHSRLCEDPERPCPFDEETEGEYCSNECANADPETCWRKYAQQHAEKRGVKHGRSFF